MATKKATPRKSTTVSKPVKRTVTKTPVRSVRTSRKASGGVFDYFRFGESYTSLILGMVVVIIATILLVAFFKNRSIQEVNPRQDITATNISPTDQKTYVVKEGDTLWSIAESQLNDGYRWTEIMKANNIKEAGNIEKGARLVLPNTSSPISNQASSSAAQDQEQVQAQSTPTPTSIPIDPTASVSTTPRPYFPDQPTDTQPQTDGKIVTQTYTVREGDTLWDISIRAYNDGYKWAEIAQKNNLLNPDLIYVGSVLQLPR